MKTKLFNNFFFLTILGVTVIISGCTSDCSEEICIITPVNNAEVEWKPLIKGKVTTDNVSNLLVLIKPLAVNECWVQPKPTRLNNGDWIVQVYAGNPDDKGKSFAIQAIGNPAKPLPVEQDIGSCDVEAEFKSDTIIVKRK